MRKRPLDLPSESETDFAVNLNPDSINKYSLSLTWFKTTRPGFTLFQIASHAMNIDASCGYACIEVDAACSVCVSVY